MKQWWLFPFLKPPVLSFTLYSKEEHVMKDKMRDRVRDKKYKIRRETREQIFTHCYPLFSLSLSWFCWRQEWKCLRSVLFERLLLVLDFFASSSSLYSHYSSSEARKSDNCLASMRYLSWERVFLSHSPASLASVYLSFDENDEVLLCFPLPFLLCLSMCLRVIHSLNHSSFTHLHPFSVILRKKKKQSSSAENKPTKLCLSLRKCLFSLVKCLSTDDDVKLETPSNSTWQRQSMQRQKEMKEDRKEKTPADSRLEIV